MDIALSSNLFLHCPAHVNTIITIDSLVYIALVGVAYSLKCVLHTIHLTHDVMLHALINVVNTHLYVFEQCLLATFLGTTFIVADIKTQTDLIVENKSPH